MTIVGIPPIRTVWHVFADEQASISFLIEKGVLIYPDHCLSCGGNVSVHGKICRCTSKDCRKSVSILSRSFFANARISVNDALLLAYLWVAGASYSSALAMSVHSPNTIVDYFGYFRQLAADSLNEEDWKIGGENIIVEVDESKFGKRKNNRGKRIEGAWVIGGIERTEESKFFVRVVKNRNHQTIVDILSDHVLEGSIVHTDLWKGYVGIDQDIGVTHRTVNHSKEFVNSATGVHTNSIEGKWAGLKRRIVLRGRVESTLPNYLFEQIWRSKHKNDLWNGFISSLREISY